MDITRLRSLLAYDAETGVLTWAVRRRGVVKVGARAGTLHHSGYLFVGVERKTYLAHRLAWAIHYGAFPALDLDHINGDKTDNRIANLRECNDHQNQGNARKWANNTSGVKGVCWAKDTGKWQAQIRVHGKSCYLGQFARIEDAAAAYAAQAREVFGEFARP